MARFFGPTIRVVGESAHNISVYPRPLSLIRERGFADSTTSSILGTRGLRYAIWPITGIPRSFIGVVYVISNYENRLHDRRFARRVLFDFTLILTLDATVC